MKERNTPLARFISQRLEEIRMEIEALRTEESQLLAAQDSAFPSHELHGQNHHSDMRRHTEVRTTRRMTIKEMVVDVLGKKHGRGTTDSILEWIEEIHGAKIVRSSMSPQLSRLKSEGRLTYYRPSKEWVLADQDPSPEVFDQHSGEEADKEVSPEEGQGV